jgi:hypothetical protein
MINQLEPPERPLSGAPIGIADILKGELARPLRALIAFSPNGFEIASQTRRQLSRPDEVLSL